MKELQSGGISRKYVVDPRKINRDLFKNQREDEKQEEVRKLILNAFDKAKYFPQKYDRPFETWIPKKNWKECSVEEAKVFAYNFGDTIADWIHQAFEWAQRITDGESWETICNAHDDNEWYRLVIWKRDYARPIGGSCYTVICETQATIHRAIYDEKYTMSRHVPLVVKYL